MAELKTKPNKASVKKFLNSVKDEKRRDDCFQVLEIMKKITKEEPIMWGPSIVGFGSYHFRHANSNAIISQLFHLGTRRAVQGGAGGWCRVLAHFLPHRHPHVDSDSDGHADLAVH